MQKSSSFLCFTLLPCTRSPHMCHDASYTKQCSLRKKNLGILHKAASGFLGFCRCQHLRNSLPFASHALSKPLSSPPGIFPTLVNPTLRGVRAKFADKFLPYFWGKQRHLKANIRFSSGQVFLGHYFSSLYVCPLC